MRKLIAFLFLASVRLAACGGNGYTYCQSIVMDHTQAGTADTTNFVLWTFDTDSHWATVANGGVIQNTATQTGGGASITVPADAIFTSDSACGTKLKWEFEDYTSSTGARNVWVQVPTLSHTTDTTIYECLGKSSVTTWQGDVPGTWDAGTYVWVEHLPSVSSINDSSSQANTCTNTSTTSVAGLIGNGASGSGSGQWISCSHTGFPFGAAALTAEAWFKPSSLPASYHTVVNVGNVAAANQSVGLWQNINSLYAGGAGNSIQDAGVLASGTWAFGALTYDGTTQTCYFNGASCGSNAQTFNITFTTGIARIFDDGFSETFGGVVDEVRYLKVTATSSRILADYNSTKPGTNFYSLAAGTATMVPRRRVVIQ